MDTQIINEMIAATTFNDNILNIHIPNSYLVTDEKDMEYILDELMRDPRYAALQGKGFARSRVSLLREWKAHTVLYNWGIFKERTGSVDLNQDESVIRRIGYFFLSLLF